MRISFRRTPLVVMGGFSILCAGMSIAQPVGKGGAFLHSPSSSTPADLSILTYNVKGLPWPVAWGREQAFGSIAARLATMRRQRRQPDVVVLQEAFVDDAKAIGDRAGYRYRVVGADSAEEIGVFRGSGIWYRGETQGVHLDSGLVVLSDFPVVDVKRATFPPSACAGYDCLAAKGVLIVTIRTAQGQNVAVATTHLNSRSASGAPVPESTRAYREQVAFVARFLKENWDRRIPLVLVGDFNLGRRKDRLAILPARLESVAGKMPVEALRGAISDGLCDEAGIEDAISIRDHARDMQFVFEDTDRTVLPVGLSVPFGSEQGQEPLSDHMGFKIEYRLSGSRRS